MKTHMLTCSVLIAFTSPYFPAAVGQPVVFPGKLPEYQQKALELINKLRAKHHSPALQYDQEVSMDIHT